jgi:hypothetical protein
VAGTRRGNTGRYISHDPGERFWAKVDKTTDCWLWMAGGDRKGYGTFWTGDRFQKAHRFAYEQEKGPIPDNLQLDHLVTCPKNCVNPEHLRLATNKQNEENRAGAQSNNRSSGIRGVYWNKHRNKWYVQVQHNGKRYHNGYYALGQLVEAEAAVIALRNQLFTHNDLDRLT